MAFGGPTVTYHQALTDLTERIGRKKASMLIVPKPPGDARPFLVAAGSPNALRVNGGFIVTFDLDRVQLEMIRDVCTALLAHDP